MENTYSQYLGSHYQLKLFWQILTDGEFGERVVKFLSVDYFDDINFKKLFLIIKQYYDEYEHIPSIRNKNIYHAVKKYTNPNNTIESDVLNEIIKQIEYWEEGVLNQKIPYDGDVVQNETFFFIKQQEYRKLSEQIMNDVKTGQIRSKKRIFEIEENISKINNIGDNEDYGVELTEDIKAAFNKKFREPIPTGILGLDDISGGGLGKGEIGIILAPSGVGKTSILTKIANSALEDGKNVLQIVFEDTDDEIRRKHYALWSKIPLSEINDRKDEAEQIVSDHVKNINNKLIIKRFDEDETTIVDIKNWIDTYQKKFGVKFDMVVLDYIDCLEPHKTAVDQNQVELSIIKYFISMAGKYNIPMWTAVQANRSGFNAEFVDQTQMGGNIKRAQKSHLLMSVAKSQEQKRNGLANIQLLKARFAPDGFTFKDCIFNNDTMEIRITDTVPKTRRLNVDNDPEKLENKINNHVQESKEIFDKNEIKDLLNE